MNFIYRYALREVISALDFLRLQSLPPEQASVLVNAILTLRRVEGGIDAHFEGWPVPVRRRRVPVDPIDRAPPLDP